MRTRECNPFQDFDEIESASQEEQLWATGFVTVETLDTGPNVYTDIETGFEITDVWYRDNHLVRFRQKLTHDRPVLYKIFLLVLVQIRYSKLLYYMLIAPHILY